MTTIALSVKCVIIDQEYLTDLRPMSDLWDPVLQAEAPAYLVSAFSDDDPPIRRSRLAFSILARDLAPVLFP